MRVAVAQDRVVERLNICPILWCLYSFFFSFVLPIQSLYVIGLSKSHLWALSHRATFGGGERGHDEMIVLGLARMTDSTGKGEDCLQEMDDDNPGGLPDADSPTRTRALVPRCGIEKIYPRLPKERRVIRKRIALAGLVGPECRRP